jgi:hypothetical protein
MTSQSQLENYRHASDEDDYYLANILPFSHVHSSIAHEHSLRVSQHPDLEPKLGRLVRHENSKSTAATERYQRLIYRDDTPWDPESPAVLREAIEDSLEGSKFVVSGALQTVVESHTFHQKPVAISSEAHVSI